MWRSDKWWKTESPIVLFLVGVGLFLGSGAYLYRFANGTPLDVFEWGIVVIFPLYGLFFLLRAKHEVDRHQHNG